MANDTSAAQAQLLEAITKLATKASADQTQSQVSLRQAAAVNHLAEAYAWLYYPNQPHGGSSHTEA